MTQMPPDLLAGWDILIIDDEEDSLEVARFILDFYGATVHTARDGREGFEAAQRVLPKVIISDLSMPEVSGWDFIKSAKENALTREIPVIALTAHAMIGDQKKALAAGFHNYLTKPLTVETFIHELVRILMAIPVLSESLNI